MSINQADKENTDFLLRMLARIPELKSVYREHRKIGGSILPHILMGDITRFIIEKHRQDLGLSCKSTTLERCLDFLEQGMVKGAETEAVQELISVSFLENLAQSDELYDSLRDELGASLGTELKFYEDEFGDPPQAPQMPHVENAALRKVMRDLFPGSK